MQNPEVFQLINGINTTFVTTNVNIGSSLFSGTKTSNNQPLLQPWTTVLKPNGRRIGYVGFVTVDMYAKESNVNKVQFPIDLTPLSYISDVQTAVNQIYASFSGQIDAVIVVTSGFSSYSTFASSVITLINNTTGIHAVVISQTLSSSTISGNTAVCFSVIIYFYLN